MSVISKADLDTDSLGMSEDPLVRDLSDDAFIDFFVDEKFNSRDMAEHIDWLGQSVESDDDAGGSAGLPEIEWGSDSERDGAIGSAARVARARDVILIRFWCARDSRATRFLRPRIDLLADRWCCGVVPAVSQGVV